MIISIRVFKIEIKKTSFFFLINKKKEEKIIPKEYTQTQNFNKKLILMTSEYKFIPRETASSMGETVYSISLNLKLNFKINKKIIEHKERAKNIN
jgi:beta-xylosidase